MIPRPDEGARRGVTTGPVRYPDKSAHVTVHVSAAVVGLVAYVIVAFAVKAIAKDELAALASRRPAS